MAMKLVSVFGLLLLVGGAARAEETLVEKAKDGADSAVESVDKSAHKAKRKMKHHGRKAKTDIQNSNDDNEARKAGRRVKDAGNDALDKVDDTVHGH